MRDPQKLIAKQMRRARMTPEQRRIRKAAFRIIGGVYRTSDHKILKAEAERREKGKNDAIN